MPEGWLLVLCYWLLVEAVFNGDTDHLICPNPTNNQ